jgi:molybdopterin-guanine dinucleotide biosynthesis protein A
MGVDKANLLLGCESMAGRQARLLGSVCRAVAIIGPHAKLAGTEVPVYEDEIPGMGPLGGIHAGLRRARTEFSLFLSCDMPRMEGRFLRYLCEQALASRAAATLPPPGGKGRYPLCAVLRRSVLPLLRSHLASGRNRVGRFFASLPRRTVSKAEFARAGFKARIFYNVNTPEDYRQVR